MCVIWPHTLRTDMHALCTVCPLRLRVLVDGTAEPESAVAKQLEIWRQRPNMHFVTRGAVKS